MPSINQLVLRLKTPAPYVSKYTAFAYTVEATEDFVLAEIAFAAGRSQQRFETGKSLDGPGCSWEEASPQNMRLRLFQT